MSIDDRTNELVQSTSRRLGGGAVAPERHFESPDDLKLSDQSLLRKKPDSVNPPAANLKYSVADEARDVSARLSQLQAESNESPIQMTLSEAFKQAQLTSREHLNREEDYILAAIRLLQQRHLWDPRLFHQLSATYSSVQTDGHSDTALHIVNELAATQQIPSGGQVAARWIWDATENLRSTATGQYQQSSRIVLDGTIPLLRGAGSVAEEGRIQAERDLVYAARSYEQFRREFLVAIANDFFSLLLQQGLIQNSQERLTSLEQVEQKERALYAAGRKQALEVNNAANQTLQARSDVANQKDRYILSLDRFKVRLGIPVSTSVQIVSSELDLPEPDISLEEATRIALDYRLDLQNQRDMVDDARRGVKNARNGLLPDLNIAGNVTFPTDADAREGGAVYEPDDVQYSGSVTFGLPLDRENERLALRASIIQFQQSQRSYDLFRDNLILDVRLKVRAIELARFNLRLADERVKISERRKLEVELKKDEIDTQQKIDALLDLQAAQNARDQAKADLRNSVLDYLVATGQLRVGRDGAIERLPGMESGQKPPEPPPPETPSAAPVPTGVGP